MGTVQEARMDLAIHAQLECYSMHTRVVLLELEFNTV